MPKTRQCDIVAALIGAPNVGKTSLFNAITGKAETVANWPGVTVDVKMAVVRRNGARICIVDLPGAYGLSGSGPEESVTRDFLLRENPDVVVALAEAPSLEKSLYLPVEAREACSRVVVALTKMDAAVEKGIRIDLEGLSRDLGAPVVATSALRGEGLEELLEQVLRVSRARGRPLRINYGALEPYIARLTELLAARCPKLPPERRRWLAVRLLEGLEWTREALERSCDGVARELLEEAEKLRREYISTTGRDPGADAVAARYRFVEEVVARRVVRHGEEIRAEKLDHILMHPVVGPLVSLLLLLAVFFTVFTVNTGFPLNVVLDALGFRGAAELLEEYSIAGLLGKAFDILAEVVRGSVKPEWLASILADGVIKGVGLVLSFAPLIATVYAIMGLLEDAGIAPRMAISFDPLLRRFGLSGKSLFPMVMSLGCNVPAVMSTRILESRRERLAVMLALPLIPCQARLAVLLAFIAAFFTREGPAVAAAVALGIYLVAFAAYLFTAWLFTRLLGGTEEEYVLEIPPLKKPSLRVVWWYTRSSLVHFLERAGTIILALSIVTWLATSYTPSLQPAASASESIAAALGRLLAPLASMVFGVGYETAWRLGFAFLEGLVAKEVFLDALAMTAPGGLATASPQEALAYLNLTPVQAFAVLVALTLYMPCIATLATIYTESRSLKLTLADLAYTLALATLLAWLVRLALEAFA